jgi:hypothetical protein
VEDRRQKKEAKVLADKRRRHDKSWRHQASVEKRWQCRSTKGGGASKEEEKA